MTRIRSFILVLVAGTACALSATGPVSLESVIESLRQSGCLSAQASYEVYLPSAAEPVTYSIELSVADNPADTLLGCSYLIDWQLPRGERTATGFNAYFDGNHFRYRDTKLQEYHFSDDPIPFLTERGGVHRQAQFADLLPLILADKLESMMSDTTYTFRWDDRNLSISGSQRIKGFDAMTFDYRFNPESLLPSEISIDYNPASISEQNVTIRYQWTDADPCPTISETELVNRYPDVFQRFRVSNFRIENLRGTSLPSFTGLTPTRERYAYNRGEKPAAPTLLVFIDPAVGNPAETVSAIRSAVSMLPKAVNAIYLFDRATIEDADEIVGPIQLGETILTNASALSRDMGVTTRPTVVISDTEGIIRDVLIGVNKDLEEIVIQKMTLIE